MSIQFDSESRAHNRPTNGAQLVELWEMADQLGYDSLWTFDHLYPMLVPDPSGPCFEGWTTLTALSQHTIRRSCSALCELQQFSEIQL